VLTDRESSVTEIKVKTLNPGSEWVWGAFKLTGRHLADLHRLWIERNCSDEYLGTLVNAYLESGGRARGVKGGKIYVDVGTLHGYREALRVLSNMALHEAA
jgi:glucose-1-phosphate thymidylyltransferase